MNISYDLEDAINILFQEHMQSDFYKDTIGFLNRSDADEAMIPRFYTNYGIQAFISEQNQSYKNDDKNTMFKELLKFYDADPRKVIHMKIFCR